MQVSGARDADPKTAPAPASANAGGVEAESGEERVHPMREECARRRAGHERRREHPAGHSAAECDQEGKKLQRGEQGERADLDAPIQDSGIDAVSAPEDQRERQTDQSYPKPCDGLIPRCSDWPSPEQRPHAIEAVAKSRAEQSASRAEHGV